MHRFPVAVAFVIAAVASGLLGCGGSSESPPATQPPPSPQVKTTVPAAPAPAAVRVTAIEVGKAINAQKRVEQPTTTFAPTDTLYVSILTDGSASNATLGARWTYEGGTVVKEDTQTIAPTGATATEFHVAKPSGWPAGNYKVEVSLNGSPASARDFEVKP
jgi:hypothetical protein